MINPALAKTAEIQYGLLMGRIQKLIAEGAKPGFNYGPPTRYGSISYKVQLRFPPKGSK